MSLNEGKNPTIKGKIIIKKKPAKKVVLYFFCPSNWLDIAKIGIFLFLTFPRFHSMISCRQKSSVLSVFPSAEVGRQRKSAEECLFPPQGDARWGSPRGSARARTPKPPPSPPGRPKSPFVAFSAFRLRRRLFLRASLELELHNTARSVVWSSDLKFSFFEFLNRFYFYFFPSS